MAILEPQQITLRDGATVTLRMPTDDDAPAMVAYLDAVRRETEQILFSPADTLPTLDEERAWIGAHVDGPASLLRLAEVDGRIVAVLFVGGGAHVRVRHVGTLGISVRSAWRGRGLGRLMMQEAIAWARGNVGLTLLELDVFAHNTTTRALYEKLGFVEVGRRPRGLRYEDGRYGDVVTMSLWVGGAEPAADVEARPAANVKMP